MNENVKIHMHYGGHFQWKPVIKYIGGKEKIFRGWDPDELSMIELYNMYKEVDKRSCEVNFYYCVPDCQLHKGLLEIKREDDINIMNECCKEFPVRIIYVVSDELSFDEQNGNKNDVIGDDDDEEPEWLREGLETIEDEDIFDTRQKNIIPESENVQNENVQSEKGKKLPMRRVDKQPIDNKFQNAQNIGAENMTASNRNMPSSNVENEEWNEPIVDEEILLGKYGSDSDWDTEYLDFNPEVEFKKPQFELKVGNIFTNFKVFIMVLKEWNIREGYTVHWIRNDRRRITAVCDKGCSWRIHASQVGGNSTFQIKTLKGNHVCCREYKNKHASYVYLSQKYQPKIRDDPTCGLIGLQNQIKRELMLDVSIHKVYRAKRKAKDDMQGVDMEQYNNIWTYGETLRKYNPGSTVKLKIQNLRNDSTCTFQRLYYCLHACKKGFMDGCRPIIGLDGCFLKTPFGGQFLTAMGRYGNDNMIPIAFAVVEVECFDSWMWFLEFLISDIGMSFNNIPWTFISDRQKGLVHAISQLFPNAEHRFCLRHLYQNFHKKYKDKEMEKLLWSATSAGNIMEWKMTMNEMTKLDASAASWLLKFPPQLWSRSHFSIRSKCDIIVNNLNESFNNYILQARDKPIISMLEWIRQKLMERIEVKRTGMEKYEGRICPNIKDKIDERIRMSRFCVAIYAGQGQFEVDSGERRYVVNLMDMTCTCGLFQLTGIPCAHAIAAIQRDKKKVEDFVDECYSKSAYLRVYAHMIYPLPSKEYWKETNEVAVNPPEVKRQPGRPRKMRKRGLNEPTKSQVSTRKGLVVHCKRCFQPNHNSRTCKNKIHPKSKFYKTPQSSNSGTANNPQSNAQTKAFQSDNDVTDINPQTNTQTETLQSDKVRTAYNPQLKAQNEQPHSNFGENAQPKSSAHPTIVVSNVQGKSYSQPTTSSAAKVVPMWQS